MAADILLTPESLLEEYANLLKNKAALDQVVNDIANNIIKTLVESWQGEAQQAFENSFNQKKATFDKFSEEMQKFADFIKTYADEMKALEDKQKAAAAQLAG